MADSNFDSNIVGKNGTETISNFASISGTALVGALTGNVTGNVTGNATSTSVKASSFIKIGDGTGCKYLFATSYAIQASIVAQVRAISGVSTASLQGSYAFSTSNPWIFTATDLATPITVP